MPGAHFPTYRHVPPAPTNAEEGGAASSTSAEWEYPWQKDLADDDTSSREIRREELLRLMLGGEREGNTAAALKAEWRAILMSTTPAVKAARARASTFHGGSHVDHGRSQPCKTTSPTRPRSRSVLFPVFDFLFNKAPGVAAVGRVSGGESQPLDKSIGRGICSETKPQTGSTMSPSNAVTTDSHGVKIRISNSLDKQSTAENARARSGSTVSPSKAVATGSRGVVLPLFCP